MGGGDELPDLKTAGPSSRSPRSATAATPTRSTTADAAPPVWEFNLRLKTDGSDRGPVPGKPVIVRTNMMGDRAAIDLRRPRGNQPVHRGAVPAGEPAGGCSPRRDTMIRRSSLSPPWRSRSARTYRHGRRASRAAMLYKNPQCTCCEEYANYLRYFGFGSLSSRPRPAADQAAVRRAEELDGCHTTLVGGYVVEGHVPVDAIDRLLDRESARSRASRCPACRQARPACLATRRARSRSTPSARAGPAHGLRDRVRRRRMRGTLTALTAALALTITAAGPLAPRAAGQDVPAGPMTPAPRPRPTSSGPRCGPTCSPTPRSSWRPSRSCSSGRRRPRPSRQGRDRRAPQRDLPRPGLPGRRQPGRGRHPGRVLRLQLPLLPQGRPGPLGAAGRRPRPAARVQGVRDPRADLRASRPGSRSRRRSRASTCRCTRP